MAAALGEVSSLREASEAQKLQVEQLVQQRDMYKELGGSGGGGGGGGRGRPRDPASRGGGPAHLGWDAARADQSLSHAHELRAATDTTNDESQPITDTQVTVIQVFI